MHPAASILHTQAGEHLSHSQTPMHAPCQSIVSVLSRTQVGFASLTSGCVVASLLSASHLIFDAPAQARRKRKPSLTHTWMDWCDEQARIHPPVHKKSCQWTDAAANYIYGHSVTNKSHPSPPLPATQVCSDTRKGISQESGREKRQSDRQEAARQKTG
mmetsp:Transcript_24441/g.60352  ORF Transcript_24441/g.60352 Transcript_24441/m.60352 type:complete len:159 (-) Transcript_24441:586-1062(-)